MAECDGRESYGLVPYDDLGRRVSRTAGNGTGAAYGYDPVSRLASLNLTGGFAATSITIGGYNPANQILSRTNGNDSYAWVGGVNGAAAYSVDGRNLYTQAGASVVQPDAKGNIAKIGGNSYSFGAENMLTTGGGSSFWHDAIGRTAYITGSGLRFDYDGDRLIGIYDSANTLLRRFVFGPGVDEPLVWYEGSGTAGRYLDADERGSITRISAQSGSTMRINTYDEYGVPGSGNLGRFGYTGQVYLSEIGMYDYKARVYAPGIGAFLQPDPTGYAAGPNLYGYVGGDPVNRTDPSGLAAHSDVKDSFEPVTGTTYDADGWTVYGPTKNNATYDPDFGWTVTGKKQGFLVPGPEYYAYASSLLGSDMLPQNGDGGEIVVTACNAACRLNRSELYRITSNNLFICGGFSVGVGGGACYGGGQGFLYGSVGTPGPEVTVGYVPGGASGYLNGTSVGATGLPGAGLSLTGLTPTSNAWLVGLPSASVSYGVSFGTIGAGIGRLGSSFGSAFSTFSNGFYNMAGRPYDLGH